MNTTNDNNTAAIIHLSTLSQYLFPFGNFIFPIIIWNSSKEKSEYIDQQGKQAINFQLSIFVYTLVLALIAIPILAVTVLNNVHFNAMIDHHNFVIRNLDSDSENIIIIALIAVFLFICLKIFEFLMTIYAAVKTSSGLPFKYPVTINFLK